MNTDALTLSGLTKEFGSARAVDGIDISVPAGAFLVLLGPSGCGKTTTLRMLAGLETPTAGTISYGGRTVSGGPRGDVPAGKRGAGMVFQSYALWPHMTVRANVEWPLKVARWSPERRQARISEVLELLAITELADRYPGEISGGQQQRVAIARTLAPEPAVLLFDEPLSNLDAKLRVETRAELMRIHRATGATSVYVTHDQVEAMTMATHIALMRNGRVEQFGTPRDFLDRPATAFTATFMGTPPANVLPAVIESDRLVVAGVDAGPADELGSGIGSVQAMYRAESLTLATGPGPRVVPLTYNEMTPIAGRWVVSGVVARSRVSVVVDVPPAVDGDTLLVALPERPDALFDGDGLLLPASSSSSSPSSSSRESAAEGSTGASTADATSAAIP